MMIAVILLSVTQTADIEAQISKAREHYSAIQERQPIRSGSFSVTSRVSGNEVVTCHWIAPQGERRSGGRSDDLVVYCPFPDDVDFAKEPDAEWKRSSFRRLAEESGFTVVGLSFQGQGKQVFDHFSEESRAQSYLFPESGSGEAVAEAIARIKADLRLPDRPAFAWGFSGGGIMAQHLAQWYPAGFDAAICQGAAVVTGRMQDPTAALLLVWTAGDAAANPCRGAEAWYRKRQTPILAIETAMDWGRRGGSLSRHCPNDAARRLMTLYLEGLSDLRREQGDRVLHRSDGWPCYALASKPERPFPAKPTGVDSSEICSFPSWGSWFAWAHRQVSVRGRVVDGAVVLSASPSPLVDRQAYVVHVRREASSSSGPSSLKEDADVEWDLRQYADSGIEAMHAGAITQPLLEDIVAAVPPGLPLVVMVERPRAEECVLLGASERIRTVAILGTVAEIMLLKHDIEELLQTGKSVALLAQVGGNEEAVAFKELQDMVNLMRRPKAQAGGAKKKPAEPPVARSISVTRLNRRESSGAEWSAIVQSVVGKVTQRSKTLPKP